MITLLLLVPSSVGGFGVVMVGDGAMTGGGAVVVEPNALKEDVSKLNVAYQCLPFVQLAHAPLRKMNILRHVWIFST